MNQTYHDLGFAKIDSSRQQRKGFSEVIYGEGKTLEQLTKISELYKEKQINLLITRIPQTFEAVIKSEWTHGKYNPVAKTFTYTPTPIQAWGDAIIISAGTSDIPVAEEAKETLAVMGNHVEVIYDCGVAGLHRLLKHVERLRQARVVIVIAGMDGALPSVVGGLISAPIIAVPTSAGYGASFQGVSALLAMLNTCAPGVVVVNIDNGFGAGYFASSINRYDAPTS